MPILLVFALMAGDAAAAASQPVHNYLKGAAPRERCGERAGSGEIVVCAKADIDAQYRLDPAVPSGVVPILRRAEVPLGAGRIGLVADQAVMPQGAVASRAMVRVTMPF